MSVWRKVNGCLIHITDPARVKFRTNISRNILEHLGKVAEEHDTYVNYLLETGLESVLAGGVIVYNKDLRPKDRIQYKTTYDMELLQAVRGFAKEKGLFINDVIEFSAGQIDPGKAKKKEYRSRTEVW